MKKIITYFFLSVYLFSFTETGQVLKFPKLVEHYISHEIKNPKTSLVSFIKMHYWDDSVKDADYEEDMKLPFKSHNHCCVSISIQAPPKTFEFSFECKRLFLDKNQNFTYSESFTSQKISTVFRPPILG